MATADFAELVVNAYKNEKALGKIFNCFGPEVYTVKEAVEKYCKLAHPEIKKIGEVPVWLMKFIGVISGKKMLKFFAELSDYFTKVDEREFAIKPMNCPGSTLVFGERPRSYRDLPLRYAELGMDLVAIAEDLTLSQEALGHGLSRRARNGRAVVAVTGAVLRHVLS